MLVETELAELLINHPTQAVVGPFVVKGRALVQEMVAIAVSASLIRPISLRDPILFRSVVFVGVFAAFLQGQQPADAEF